MAASSLVGSLKKHWVISCCAITIASLVSALSIAGISGSLEEKSILERIKPEGEVTLDPTGQTQVKTDTTVIVDVGQKYYEQICKTCHETGLADAPKFGNKEDWKPRIAQGMDTLIKNAIHGLKAMPPKGSCGSCTDDEIKKSVEYIVNHSK